MTFEARSILEDGVPTSILMAYAREIASTSPRSTKVGAAFFADGRFFGASNAPVAKPEKGLTEENKNHYIAHAEARLIAGAAAWGVSTRNKRLVVTRFPCAPCARLIAMAEFRYIVYLHEEDPEGGEWLESQLAAKVILFQNNIGAYKFQEPLV